MRNVRKVLLLVSILATAAVVFFFTFHPVMDPDTWFHLQLGEWILQNNALPTTDPFSYTAGDTPYVPSGWLTALLVIFADMIYPESSLGPIMMVTLAVTLAAGMVLWRGWREHTLPLTALLMLAGLTLAATRFSPRPDIWSFAGLTALLWILSRSWSVPGADHTVDTLVDETARHHKNKTQVPLALPGPAPSPRLLWLLVPLIALWANLHAGVLIALPFLFTYAIWLVVRHIRSRQEEVSDQKPAPDNSWLLALLPVVVAGFAWLANPYGWGLVRLAQRIAQMPDVTWVIEWMPFYWTQFALPWPTRAAYYIVAGLAIGLIAIRWRAFHPLEILWIAVLIILAFMQRRHVGLMGFGVPMLLSRHLVFGQAPNRDTAGADWKCVALIAAALALCAVQVKGANGTGSGWPKFGRNCAKLPCFTADFLKMHTPPQPIFNSYNLGGYLLHIVYPETKVYIDGRLDTYPPEVWEDMLALEENRLSIDDFVAKYGVKTFVLTVKESFGDSMHLASRLAARPDYVLVHLDDVAAVLVHKDDATADYLDKLGYPNLAPWDLDRMAALTADPATQEQVVVQVGRLLQQSPGSAAVHSLAAVVAKATGNQKVEQQQLRAANMIQPDNKLLQEARNR